MWNPTTLTLKMQPGIYSFSVLGLAYRVNTPWHTLTVAFHFNERDQHAVQSGPEARLPSKQQRNTGWVSADISAPRGASSSQGKTGAGKVFLRGLSQDLDGYPAAGRLFGRGELGG